MQKYHRELDHLINGHYLVGVGSTALDWMQDWWKRYRGEAATKVNKNCANCIADFLKGVGMAYFKEKGLRDQEAASKKASKGKGPKTENTPKHTPAPTGEARKNARKVSVKTETK